MELNEAIVILKAHSNWLADKKNLPKTIDEKVIDAIQVVEKRVKNIAYKPVLGVGFAKYLITVGIRSLEYRYDDKKLFDNIEYFKLCKKHNLSAYKALLFLQDYVDGDYKF